MSQTVPSDSGAVLSRLVTGLVAAGLSVLTFHAGAWYLLHLQGLMPAPYPMSPTSPLGVPTIVSLTFWGSLYGLPFAWAWPKLQGPKLLWGFALGLGAILVGALVVGPLKGRPIAVPGLRSVELNGTWGVGVAIWMMILRRVSPR
jgi:hypothetical protein